MILLFFSQSLLFLVIFFITRVFTTIVLSKFFVRKLNLNKTQKQNKNPYTKVYRKNKSY